MEGWMRRERERERERERIPPNELSPSSTQQRNPLRRSTAAAVSGGRGRDSRLVWRARAGASTALAFQSMYQNQTRPDQQEMAALTAWAKRGIHRQSMYFPPKVWKTLRVSEGGRLLSLRKCEPKICWFYMIICWRCRPWKPGFSSNVGKWSFWAIMEPHLDLVIQNGTFAIRRSGAQSLAVWA